MPVEDPLEFGIVITREDGSIERCDAKITAFAIAGALNWIAHWYREDQPLTAEQLAEAFVDVLGRGLSCRLPHLAPQNPGGVHSDK